MAIVSSGTLVAASTFNSTFVRKSANFCHTKLKHPFQNRMRLAADER